MKPSNVRRGDNGDASSMYTSYDMIGVCMMGALLQGGAGSAFGTDIGHDGMNYVLLQRKRVVWGPTLTSEDQLPQPFAQNVIFVFLSNRVLLVCEGPVMMKRAPIVLMS